MYGKYYWINVLIKHIVVAHNGIVGLTIVSNGGSHIR